MPIVEIVRFTGSDAYVNDPLVLKDAVDIILRADAWDSYDHHRSFKGHPNFPKLISSLAPAHSDGPLDVQNVDFDQDAAPALNAGATEVVFLSPRAGVDLEDFLAAVKTLRAALVEQGVRGIALGESKEKKGTWVFVLGWDSVQAHTETVAKGAFPELIGKLLALANADIKHVGLTKYV
ncbi:hypothetical protein DXG03_004918 [Asterophora parasitica]|uniref:ABM domain-containing protein n=1 Tax=Asterophora parasitica TaxID=117018 RepID=A0A9P7KI30_9AGAR|nr:hypothetical protein DXG03_004918 [Asterophora parasitica]